jgi:hypothetical protein
MATGAAQPLNSEISVFRRVRVQARNERHDTIKMMGLMRDRYVVVPGEEIRVLDTKDALVTDAWAYGHPVVRYARADVTVDTVYQGVTGLDFPVRITADRRDLHIQNTTAARTNDLFLDVQSAT